MSTLIYTRPATDLQTVVTLHLEGLELVRRDASGVRRSEATVSNIVREAELCATDSSLELGWMGLQWAAKFMEGVAA